MIINPKDGPAVNPLPTGQPSARDRAIAKLMDSNQAQANPVQNPTQVSPEELSVVKPPSDETHRVDTSDSTPSEPAATPKPKEDPLSSQYALLARKERALRAKVQQQESALKAREQAFLEREAALKAKESEYESNYISKSRFKNDPLAVLTEEGVSYDEITNAILNPQSKQDPRILAEIEKLKAEVQASKDYQVKAKEEYAAQQKQAYDQAVKQIRNEAQQLIQSDPAYEMIKETKSVSDVVELIEKTYAEDGILLSVEEAAVEVEEYLTTEAARLAKINKIRTKLQEVQKSSEQKQQASSPKQPQSGMKTLTNQVNASKPMNARERAIAAFKGELK